MIEAMARAGKSGMVAGASAPQNAGESPTAQFHRQKMRGVN
jgi:hypothetical protein